MSLLANSSLRAPLCSSSKSSLPLSELFILESLELYDQKWRWLIVRNISEIQEVQLFTCTWVPLSSAPKVLVFLCRSWEPGATSGNSIISCPIVTDFSNQFVIRSRIEEKVSFCTERSAVSYTIAMAWSHGHFVEHLPWRIIIGGIEIQTQWNEPRFEGVH